MRERINRRWPILVACFVGSAIGLPAMGVLTFGVFIRPLSHEFGWGRGEVSLGFTAMVAAIALGSLIAGFVLDRLGPKRLITLSLACFGLSLAGLQFLSRSLLVICVAYFLVAIAGLGTTPLTYSRLVSNWFDDQRGLALGIVNGGVAFGGFLMPSLAQHWISSVGWRSAYLLMGSTVWVVGLPVALGVLRDSPQPMASSTHNPGDSDVGGDPSSSQALRSVLFWWLLSIFFLAALCLYGCAGHLSALLVDRGVPVRRAALAISAFGISGMFGRLGGGYLLDRLPGQYVMATLFAAATTGICLLFTGAGIAQIYIAPILVGIGFGAEADVMPFLITRYFGLRSASELFGYMYCAFAIATGVGMYVMGAGFDKTGTYKTGLGLFLILMLVTIVAAAFLPNYQTNPARSPGDKF